jgi:hypothetical protein
LESGNAHDLAKQAFWVGTLELVLAICSLSPPNAGAYGN